MVWTLERESQMAEVMLLAVSRNSVEEESDSPLAVGQRWAGSTDRGFILAVLGQP
jgi:hypothetical protein